MACFFYDGGPPVEEFAVAADEGLGVRRVRGRFQQGLVVELDGLAEVDGPYVADGRVPSVEEGFGGADGVGGTVGEGHAEGVMKVGFGQVAEFDEVAAEGAHAGGFGQGRRGVGTGSDAGDDEFGDAEGGGVRRGLGWSLFG